jgi:hypothetical protein
MIGYYFVYPVLAMLFLFWLFAHSPDSPLY